MKIPEIYNRVHTRTRNALRNWYIDHGRGDDLPEAGELSSLYDAELLRMPNFGKTCLHDLRARLSEIGFRSPSANKPNQFHLRFHAKDELHGKLKAAAKVNGRTLSAEIRTRLEGSFAAQENANILEKLRELKTSFEASRPQPKYLYEYGGRVNGMSEVLLGPVDWVQGG